MEEDKTEYKKIASSAEVQEYVQYLIRFNSKNKILPTQRDLAEKLGVSRNAVQHALSWLKSEGHIAIRERTGAVVNQKNNINMLGMASMTDELARSQVTINHLETAVVDVPMHAKLFFGFDVKQVIKLERIHCQNNVPLTYESTYFDKKKFGQLTEVNFTNASVYEFLEKNYNVHPSYGREEISCVLADEKLSQVVKVRPKTPLYRVDSFNYQSDDVPLEYTEQYLIGDQFKYHFTANNILDYCED